RKTVRLERVGIRAAAGGDLARLVATVAEREVGELHLGVARAGPVALEHPLHGDVEVALGGVGRLLEVVDHLGGDGLRAGGVDAARLGLEVTAFGYDVGIRSASDRADVRGRLWIEATDPH